MWEPDHHHHLGHQHQHHQPTWEQEAPGGGLLSIITSSLATRAACILHTSDGYRQSKLLSSLQPVPTRVWASDSLQLHKPLQTQLWSNTETSLV